MISDFFTKATKRMLEKPITELSRYIADKWFLPLEKLFEKTGVPLTTIKRAIEGGTISREDEAKLREYLDKL